MATQGERTGGRGVVVLAVAGTGQNGATLLCKLLGALPRMVGVGELGRLWDTGLIENRDCSCGEPFLTCPFWSEVGAAGFAGWSNVDAYEISRAREAVRLKRRLLPLPREPIERLHSQSSFRFLPFQLVPALWPEYRANVGRYADAMSKLYTAIAKVADADVVVDSMKFPYHVHLLPSVPGIDPRILHVVRDSRGVAHSQTKVIEKQGGGGRYRRRRPPAKTAVRWAHVNLLCALVARRGVAYRRVRYEDIVSAPTRLLPEIARFAGETIGPGDLSFIEGAQVHLPPDHIVAGNRVRMESGPVTLRVSDRWETELEARRLVSALTWPLISRYGYVGRSARPPAGEETISGR